MTYEQVDYRVRIGRLHPVHRGVYSAGHPALAPFARELAAVLACGRGALLSHISAAFVLGMLTAVTGPVHVTVRARGRRPQPGIVLHCAAALQPARRHGIPLTTPARTLLDLAATEPDLLPRAFNEAQAQGLVRPDDLAIPAGHRGAATLRALITSDPRVTDSEAERVLLRLVARARLPRPATQVRIGRHRVDALWSDQRLVVEVDGYAFHGHRDAFEHDRGRDADLVAAGHRVIRVTWRQLTREPEAVVAALAGALAV